MRPFGLGMVPDSVRYQLPCDLVLAGESRPPWILPELLSNFEIVERSGRIAAANAGNEESRLRRKFETEQRPAAQGTLMLRSSARYTFLTVAAKIAEAVGEHSEEFPPLAVLLDHWED